MAEAVGSELLSRIVGYILTGGDFSNTTPNLPMRIAILGEANTANQAGIDITGKAYTTSQEAGEDFGFGSPIYHIMRILRPQSGSGIGGIPTIIYPQGEAIGATSRILSIEPMGVATANGTHTVKISGRTGIDGDFYDINIEVGDDAAAVAQKIEDAINNVLASPVIATADPYVCAIETKWKGLTAQETNAEVITGTANLGITYAVTKTQEASATPSISAALAQFGNEWNTIVINGYGLVSSTMDALEAFNGIPSATVPSGRYAGIIFKPFIAVSGSVLEDPSSITDTRLNNVTIAVAPAPLSLGYSFEAAANMALLAARIAQDEPHLDVAGNAYIDMPTPDAIGAMSDYLTRDAIMKKGCSTVSLVSGQYVVEDFVTTYHKLGENPPQFRYCRNLILDFNVRFGYYLLEQLHVVGHVLTNDNTIVTASKVIKPKRWKSILTTYAEGLEKRALSADKKFMTDSTTVQISSTNPDRLQTFFRYKRTGTVRVASTVAEAGFNFG